MPRFFVRADAVSVGEAGQKQISIIGEDAHHLTHVLRVRLGEEIIVCDMAGREFVSSVTSVGDTVLLSVVSERQTDTEPPYEAIVYQALVKGDKMDTVIQKAVETGCSRIVPVRTGRCTVKLDPKDAKKKTERWQRIAYEAAKQCGRGIIPTVDEPMDFRLAVKEASQMELPLFCYEGDGTVSLREITKQTEHPAQIAVFIGPEGGFSVEEAAFAESCGMRMTGLGKRILRTETAAVFVLACVSAAYEL
ncbi:MAG: 16S rRNA (uracil(1498)-N(3))-methyltransferase [Clostridia bacterium]|nr:16S rRNA (uracil(1498)-N(3))-methyltransferase [Clostridia bacterium]